MVIFRSDLRYFLGMSEVALSSSTILSYAFAEVHPAPDVADMQKPLLLLTDFKFPDPGVVVPPDECCPISFTNFLFCSISNSSCSSRIVFKTKNSLLFLSKNCGNSYSWSLMTGFRGSLCGWVLLEVTIRELSFLIIHPSPVSLQSIPIFKDCL